MTPSSNDEVHDRQPYFIFNSSQGYEWVGWKNDAVKGTTGPVEIIFQFEQVRNFTHMVLHCNNLFSKDVQVFSVATIWFSVGGVYYQEPPITFP